MDKDVGNMSWLFHIITRNIWTSPMRRLLHYPTARQGMPEFRGLQISLSNYVGEARTYLENLIAAAGAECTKHLKQSNSHLITAHGASEKCVAAKEWGVQIVNHLWLEESYAHWKRQPESNPRYTHLPLRTNLSEVVGQTEIDRAAVKGQFMPSAGQVKKVAARRSDKNGRSMRHKEDNEVPKQEASGPSAKAAIIKNEVRQEPERVTDKAEKRPKEKVKDSLTAPNLQQLKRQTQENESPSKSHSRKSKDKATALLHELGEDIALYEKEKKRAGGVLHGGPRRSVSAHDGQEETKSRKRSLNADDASNQKPKETKKVKASSSQSRIHLLVTGFKRWVEDPKLEGPDKRVLRDIGVQIVNDPKKCTHLAAPSILRTPKFLNAVAYAPQILDDRFVEHCIIKKTLLNPDDFPLQDKANEERYHISLEEVKLRAQKNKNHLLRGMILYCIENIQGGFEVFKSIAETNGGQCLIYRGRSGSLPTPARGTSDVDSENAVLISGDSAPQKKLWNRFKDHAKQADKTPRIVRVDWLVESVMAQEMRSVEEWEYKESKDL
ncbi:hypothetical protein KEM56_003857 [Ascosphaera pollenicola]|nr:hypothetical protein KEM56_003857 [Ascosphaera pollenicola]